MKFHCWKRCSRCKMEPSFIAQKRESVFLLKSCRFLFVFVFFLFLCNFCFMMVFLAMFLRLQCFIGNVRFCFLWYRRRWITSVMRSFLFFWLLEINVIWPLALFIVESRSRLRAMLRLAVSVLQAPISQFKMASFSIFRLLFVWIFLVVVGRILLLMLMCCGHAATHPV